jgi:hypothetical protein
MYRAGVNAFFSLDYTVIVSILFRAQARHH